MVVVIVAIRVFIMVQTSVTIVVVFQMLAILLRYVDYVIRIL